MPIPVRIAGLALALVLALSALGSARGEPAAPVGNRIPAGMEPLTAPPDSQRAAAHLDPAAAYREHASLAWFSLGSLAVGGVFYAIGEGLERPNVTYTAGDRSRIAAAVGAAGIGAALAAGSYFYYVHRAKARAEDSEEAAGWDAAATAGPDGAGGMRVGARLTLPLPPFP